MVKLIYNGVMATGMMNTGSYKLSVEKGKTYDIPASIVDKFLANGEWKRVSEVKAVEKPKKIIKEKYEEKQEEDE